MLISNQNPSYITAALWHRGGLRGALIGHLWCRKAPVFHSHSSFHVDFKSKSLEHHSSTMAPRGLRGALIGHLWCREAPAFQSPRWFPRQYSSHSSLLVLCILNAPDCKICTNWKSAWNTSKHHSPMVSRGLSLKPLDAIVLWCFDEFQTFLFVQFCNLVHLICIERGDWNGWNTDEEINEETGMLVPLGIIGTHLGPLLNFKGALFNI